MEVSTPINIHLISDFTIDLLGRFLSTSTAHPYEVTTAPYDQVIPALMGTTPGKPDITFVWTQPQKVSSAFQARLEGNLVSLDAILKECNEFTTLLPQAAARTRLLLIPTWTLPPAWRGLGVGEMRADQGARRAVLEMNRSLCEAVDAIPNAFVLDINPWLIETGRDAFDPRLQFHTKCPFGNAVLRRAASEIGHAWSAFCGQTKKLICIDADNTLWGGLVGEDGWEGMRIGGHDPIGEAFSAVQQILKSLQQRGILLALVSKNEEAAVREVFDKHPEMHLRWEDFAAHRVNWENKAENISSLCAELRLGVDAAVFLDDSPQERDWLRQALPEITVPELPEDPLYYADLIRALPYFDQMSLTDEDQERTAFYIAETDRENAKSSVLSYDAWVASLEIELRVESLNNANLSRAAQLLNKTNQMNLRTRRMGETELMHWADEPGHEVWTLRVKDRFGDAGLVGLFSLSLQNDTTTLEDFLLSCRVLGRRIEEALLALACQKAAEMGGRVLVAAYQETLKNSPCLHFLTGSGMKADDQSQTFSTPTNAPLSLPEGITLME